MCVLLRLAMASERAQRSRAKQVLAKALSGYCQSVRRAQAGRGARSEVARRACARALCSYTAALFKHWATRDAGRAAADAGRLCRAALLWASTQSQRTL